MFLMLMYLTLPIATTSTCFLDFPAVSQKKGGTVRELKVKAFSESILFNTLLQSSFQQ